MIASKQVRFATAIPGVVSAFASALTRFMIFLAAITASAGTAQAETVYRFSPINQYGVNLTAAYWNPIINYVSERSGIKLELKIGRTSADTLSFILAREVEFAFTNHLFSPEREKIGWKVFGTRQVPPVKAEIVVPADSPITDLAQLTGKEVAFSGPEAMLGYKFPYAQLMSRNIKIVPVFAGNHDGAFSQLYSGKVAAAGALSQLAEGYAQREGKTFRVLWASEPMPELALMVAPQVPPADAKAIADAFFALAKDPKGRQLIHKVSETVGMSADVFFVPAQGSEYDAYRRFYQSVPVGLH
jgi:phosphonate transport system substrate-binding protein